MADEQGPEETSSSPVFSDLGSLRAALARFTRVRDWDQFHTPKNLASPLVVEAGELLEHFQWLEGEESASLPTETRERVEKELGDVLIYLVRLADVLGLDLLTAASRKLEENEKKYPADQVRGRALKYDAYDR